MMVLLTLTAMSILTWLFFGLIAFMRLRHRALGTDQLELPPLTILKPIKGADPMVESNLRSFVNQDYPEFQILFGVRDHDDPIIPIIRTLQRDYPEQDIDLVLGAPDLVMNPKVNNLRHMIKSARHDLVLISDADVEAPPGYLRTIVTEKLLTGAGLVHSPLTSPTSGSLGAKLEALQLNDFVAASIAGSCFLGHQCVIGKSMLFNLSDFVALGRFDGIGNVINEDYMLGRRFAKAGKGVHLSAMPVIVRNEHRHVRGFLERHLRWSKMRRSMGLWSYTMELLLHPTPWLLLLAATVVYGRGHEALALDRQTALAALAAALIFKIGVNELLAQRYSFKPIGTGSWPLILLKDILVIVIWSCGLVDNRVNWRGKVMHLESGGKLRMAPDSNSMTAGSRV
ncbi:MAG: glycosyltransferase [Myxococcota bacterium]|nr:glycosyltransferase [Myxococcota bacterium]